MSIPDREQLITQIAGDVRGNASWRRYDGAEDLRARGPVTPARPSIELDADLEQRIEALAARCTHANTPCDACTTLAVEAVETLVASGWLTQIRRYQNRKDPDHG